MTGGFAGHCDWRLPTIVELEGIVDMTASGCGSGSPCIDSIFGPTVTNFYWSATSKANLFFAWDVVSDTGFVNDNAKNSDGYVRAVRAGL